MRLLSKIAILFLCSATYADDVVTVHNHLELTCPPVAALSHAKPGRDWTLAAPYDQQGWYVVREMSVQSDLTSFKNRVGVMDVYLQNNGGSLEATCHYSSPDSSRDKLNDVHIKSAYPYAAGYLDIDNSDAQLSNAMFKYDDKTSRYVCTQVFFMGEIQAPTKCKWIADDFSNIHPVN